MPSAEYLLPFLMASIIFAVMPGPALLYTAAQTLARGRRGALLAVLGLHAGGFAHVLAAAVGLSVVFRHVPEAYMALKIAGALYLAWLGVGIMLHRVSPEALPTAKDKDLRRAFLESVLVEVLNPKSAIFYIAFLPQFVDPAAALPLWAQFLILGCIVNVFASLADIVAIFLTDAVVAK